MGHTSLSKSEAMHHGDHRMLGVGRDLCGSSPTPLHEASARHGFVAVTGFGV